MVSVRRRWSLCAKPLAMLALAVEANGKRLKVHCLLIENIRHMFAQQGMTNVGAPALHCEKWRLQFSGGGSARKRSKFRIVRLIHAEC